uniref:CCHC-type domain-containing protein n=1 Tax=Peronospora matthiolae TaxID=2874970 RepID=A0AAV1UNE1_9STRA
MLEDLRLPCHASQLLTNQRLEYVMHFAATGDTRRTLASRTPRVPLVYKLSDVMDCSTQHVTHLSTSTESLHAKATWLRLVEAEHTTDLETRAGTATANPWPRVVAAKFYAKNLEGTPTRQSFGLVEQVVPVEWQQFRGRSRVRTHATEMETTTNQRKCHNCSQTGHLRRDCPEAPSSEGGFSGYPSGAPCFGCGQVGHLKRDCPTITNGRACHNCGQAGHLRRDCPEDVQPPKCHNCGEAGHLRRDCPQELRESRKCHHCGQGGHLRRDCPEDSGPSEDKCYQCGENGHWARNCPGGAVE